MCLYFFNQIYTIFLILISLFFPQLHNFEVGPTFNGPLLNNFTPTVEVESLVKDSKSQTITLNTYFIHSSASPSNDNISFSDSKIPAVALSSSTTQASNSSVEGSGHKKRKESPSQDNVPTKVSRAKLAGDGTSCYDNEQYRKFAFETFLRYFATLPQKRILTEEEEEEGVSVDTYNELE